MHVDHLGRGVKLEPSAYVNDWKQQERTWRERLFSLPWQPFKKWKSVHFPQAYQVEGPNSFIYFVSPATYARLTKDEPAK